MKNLLILSVLELIDQICFYFSLPELLHAVESVQLVLTPVWVFGHQKFNDYKVFENILQTKKVE